MLVFDMRSRYNFHQCHIKDSISFPIDLCNEEFFIKWDTADILKHIIKNKVKQEIFKDRKRLFVYIIAGQNDL
jgi:hypothetical protein